MSEIINNLEQHVVLVSPTLGRWEGRYTVPPELVKVETAVEGIEKPDSLTSPRTRLLNRTWPVDEEGVPWKSRFDTVVTRKNSVINKYSLPFPIRGVRVIPKVRAADFYAATIGEGSEGDASIQQAWSAAANDFCRQLEDVYQQIESHLPESIWKAIQPKLPRTEEDMRRKFYFAIFPVEFPTAETAVRIGGEELRQYQDIVARTCEQTVEQALEQILERPRQELAEVLMRLKELVDRGGRVTAKSFRPVQAAIDKIRAFAFIGDERLLETLSQLEGMLGNTDTKSLKNDAVARGFSAAIKAIADDITDAEQVAEAAARFGLKRPIRRFSGKAAVV